MFDSDTLSFKAYTYVSNRTPISLSTETIDLVPKGNGKYGVDANHILIKVHSAALNPVDILIHRSTYPVFSCSSSKYGTGRDYAGTIEDIGENAANKSGLKVGDEVFGFYRHYFGKGTVTEYMLIDGVNEDDSTITKKPSNISWNEAAAVPLVYGTAVLMMKGHDLSGKKVLVLGGATSVGRYIIQLAKLGGAREIVTTNSSRSNEMVAELGSSKQIDYTKQPSILEPVLNSVKESGEFDYIYDTAGGNDLIGNLNHILKPKSTKSAYVTSVGDSKYSYANAHILNSVGPALPSIIRVISSALGLSSINYTFVSVLPGKQWIETAEKLLEENKLQVFVDSVYKFDDFDKALARVE